MTPFLGSENHCIVNYEALLQQAYDFLSEYFVFICVLALVLPALGMTWSHLKNRKDSKFPFEDDIRQI